MYFFNLTLVKVINTSYSEYQSYTLPTWAAMYFFNLTLVKVINTSFSEYQSYTLPTAVFPSPPRLFFPPPGLKNIAVALFAFSWLLARLSIHSCLLILWISSVILSLEMPHLYVYLDYLFLIKFLSLFVFSVSVLYLIYMLQILSFLCWVSLNFGYCLSSYASF